MAEIVIRRAASLHEEYWEQLQQLHYEALSSSLQDRAKARAAVQYGDLNGYIASRRNPNVAVYGAFNPNQAFSRSRVALAVENHRLVGYTYAADNVSGANRREQLMKRITSVKNYLWLREVAVTPNFQRRGLARAMGRALLSTARPLQPASTYIWPDELPQLQPTLQRYGFYATGEQMVQVFGPDSEPVRQVRMQADSARTVADQLRQ